MTREEITAACTAQPTPYGREVIVAARQTGRRVAIVSNNPTESVHAYLTARRLTSYVHPLVGRPEAAPERMKPGPVLARCGAASPARPSTAPGR
ncbi:HAD family hydrolase [Micromonospora sp. WMMA1363]|uniref:HAD family hydrolase n=1 Tax=Micromonospora sp. WMMA1363 TaxID=3053985 RepID=UPI00259C90F5|nr:HAD family hydrolase [Micromonospora sp. WMMA1363]MDM4720113.1 HAD family hydrolase [Micromonospora sp. WMMA1363]